MKRATFWGVAIALLCALLVAAVALGTVPLQPSAVAAAVAGRGDAETILLSQVRQLGSDRRESFDKAAVVAS